MKKTLKVLALCSSLFLVSGCSCDSNQSGDNSETEQTLKYFDNVKFEDKRVEFNGMPHTISPVGLPADTVVSYIGENSFIDVGTYSITISLSKDGYQSKNLTAKLIITKPLIKGVSLIEEKTVIYDGNDHAKDITLKGEIPEGVKVEGPIIKKGNNQVSEAIGVGEYNFHFKLSKEGYESLHLYSTLIIEGKEFTGVSLNAQNKEIPYDGNDHINEYSVNKLLHPNAVVEKVVKKDDVVVTEVKEVGEYIFTFKVSQENFKDKYLETKLTIFDGKMIVERNNNINILKTKDESGNNVSKLIFMDLHNLGKITSLDGKKAEPKLVCDLEIEEYTVSGNTLFIKDKTGLIKYGEIRDNLELVDFPDQQANMDFNYIQGKALIYTRNNENSGMIEICELKADKSIAILYSGNGISKIKTNQNKVYFLESSGLFNKTIKVFSYISEGEAVTPSVLNEGITNVIDYYIEGKNIYFSSGVLEKSISSYNLYGIEKVVKKLFTIQGDSVEFIVEGNEIIYKNNVLIGDAKQGIFKHYIDLNTEDLLLFDTKKAEMNINSITYFDGQIFFSNKSARNCHLYRIPSIGESETATLVK